MSKTRDTGFLGSVIKVDTSGNVSFVSGSTTLATINTSGQLSGSSPVLSSSYAINATSASYAVSASNATNAVTASFANAFTVANTLTATTLVVQTVSSSVIYSSGSNVFGNNIANTQTFTGSLLVSGSISSTGTITGSAILINQSGPGFVTIGNSGSYGSISSGGGGATLYLNGSARGGGTTGASNTVVLATDGNFYISDSTSNTHKMFVSSSGNIGIGTTIPDSYLSTQLVVSAPSFGGITIASTNNTNTNYLCFARGTTSILPYMGSVSYSHTSNFMAFATSGSERMRINSTGSIGIGATNITGKLMLYQSTTGNIFTTIASNQGGSTRAGISLNPSMNESDVATYEAQSAIYSTDYNYSARMNFATKAPGGYANSLTTRMLIFEGGNISIGGSYATSYTDTTLSVTGAGTTSSTYAFIVKNSTPSDLFIVRNDGNVGIGINPGCKLDISGGYMALNDYALRWRYASDANHATVFTATYNGPIMYGYSGAALGYQAIGVIWTSTTGAYNYNNSTTWQQTSDIKIKQNLRPITGALSKLCSLNPTHFEYKNKPGKTKTGFIAQEFEQVFEGHVTETDPLPEHQEYFAEGEMIKSLDADLIPYLVKAIQELKAENDTLKEILQRNNIQ
jgi:hypothetical protein